MTRPIESKDMLSTMNTMRQLYLVAALLVMSSCCEGFVVSSPRQGLCPSGWSTALFADAPENEVEEPKMNPKNPNLPELKGDFDWDAKFGSDSDWITDNVPGKIVLNEIELAKQVTALNQLEEKWRKERLVKEFEEEKNLGLTAKAEMLNGRFAMFFLLTGLLTEYWTGVTLPGQVEEMLRVGGFIGFE